MLFLRHKSCRMEILLIGSCRKDADCGPNEIYVCEKGYEEGNWKGNCVEKGK